MGGKASLLLVLGFSLIFLIFEQNYGSYSLRSFDNLLGYYENTNAYNIALAGANMASNQLFLNDYWEEGYTDVSFNDGTFNVYVDNPLVTGSGKVAICHIPPGNPMNKHTIYVGASAVPAHLAHGDVLGECGASSTGIPTITIVSEGQYGDSYSRIVVKLQSRKFSEYAYFSIIEPSNIWWTAKDSVFGPFHTNGHLRCDNHPYFGDQVSIWGKIKYRNNKNQDKPIIKGSFHNDKYLQIPTDGVDNLEIAAENNGVEFNGKDKVFLEFIGDSIKYRFDSDTTSITVLGSDLTNNGVIFADNSELHILGEIDGRYSVGCSGTTGNRGKVYLDGDVFYKDDPRTNSSSDDMLGVVAERDVVVANTPENNSGGITIQGSMYAETGSFEVEDYSSVPYSGNIDLLGGIIQYQRGAVGTFSSSGSSTTYLSGFTKKYRYDERLKNSSPPSFPGTGDFKIVSWLEQVDRVD